MMWKLFRKRISNSAACGEMIKMKSLLPFDRWYLARNGAAPTTTTKIVATIDISTKTGRRWPAGLLPLPATAAAIRLPAQGLEIKDEGRRNRRQVAASCNSRVRQKSPCFCCPKVLLWMFVSLWGPISKKSHRRVASLLRNRSISVALNLSFFDLGVEMLLVSHIF